MIMCCVVLFAFCCVFPVNVTNFHTSWRDGLAFCALIATFAPDSLDFTQRSKDKMVENLTVAFKTAEDLGIPALLDVQGLCWLVLMCVVCSVRNDCLLWAYRFC